MKFKKLLTLVAAGFLTVGASTTLASCGDSTQGTSQTSSSTNSGSSSTGNTSSSTGNSSSSTGNSSSSTGNSSSTGDTAVPEEFTALNKVGDLQNNEIVKVEGIVAYVVNNNSMSPLGYFIVDNDGNSLYIFTKTGDIGVKVGNKVQLTGKKQVYKGATQISEPNVLNNDDKTNQIPTAATDSTIADLIALKADSVVNRKVYKVTGTVVKEGNEKYTNYYLSTDNTKENGFRFYTQASGKDLAQILEQYVGQEITTLVTAYDFSKSTRIVPLVILK